MTKKQIKKFLSEIKYDEDKRNTPEQHRRRAFKSGYRDAVVRKKKYSANTYQYLTWYNLGNRYGWKQKRGVTPREFDRDLEMFIEIYNEENN